MKFLITGAVKSGKTTLANEKASKVEEFIKNMVPQETALIVPVPVLTTDELIGKMDWSAESAEVATWFDRPDSMIIEGATVVRALRKWLASHPEGKPCDVVIYLLNPMEELTKGQVSSCKAQMTIWNQIKDELIRRGVDVQVLDNKRKTEE